MDAAKNRNVSRGPVPVHVVTGAPGSGKTALIARLCAGRPHWVGLVNGRGLAAAAPNLRALPAGCPCCTGRVALQVTLVRALRETGAQRAFVELPGPEHAANLEKVLADAPLAAALVTARRVCLPLDANLAAADFEPVQGQRTLDTA